MKQPNKCAECGGTFEEKSIRRIVMRTALLLVFVSSVGSHFGQQATLEGEQNSPTARLHEDALVVDGHVHVISRVFYEGIDPWKPQVTGLFDFARAKEGGLDLAIHTVFVEDAYNRYNYTVKQACRLIEIFHRTLEANPDKMELALTSADVRNIVRNGKMAQILALEGGFDMEGDLEVLRLFYRLGVRMIQFVNHNTTNAYADAWVGEQKWLGINELGRKIIREMNRLGILIDISHASEAARLQIIAASEAPVVASHVGVKHLSDYPQNLSERVIKALAAKEGVIALTGYGPMISQKYWDWYQKRPKPVRTKSRGESLSSVIRPASSNDVEYITELDAELRDRWVNGPSWWYSKPWRETVPVGAPRPTVEDLVRTVDYVVNLVGADHVAMGLDLMWGRDWLDNFDATSYPRLTEALVARGYDAQTVRKILGENWLRLLDMAKVVK